MEVHTPCWPGAALESGHGPDGFRLLDVHFLDGVSFLYVIHVFEEI